MIPEIMEIISRCLSKERDHAKEVVECIIDSEQNYLFTNDKEYKENRQDIVQPTSDLNLQNNMNDPNMNPNQDPQQF
jgi:hypothetical protein